MLNKRQQQLAWLAEDMARQSDLHMLTLTVAGTYVSLKEILICWRSLLRSKWWRKKDFKFVRVCESHPNGHGWHIHLLVDRYVNVSVLRKYTTKAGFGRIHIERADKGAGLYLGKYIGKALNRNKGIWAHERPDYEQCKGCRLVGQSRGMLRMSDIKEEDFGIELFREFLRHFKHSGLKFPKLAFMFQNFKLNFFKKNKKSLLTYARKYGIIQAVLLSEKFLSAVDWSMWNNPEINNHEKCSTWNNF